MTITTQCVISGGGPAGIMLGYLLARQGVDVTVLEKWPDFFRDFRGDTIHPSTMELLHELGLLERFLELPHQRSYEIAGFVNDEKISIADFSHLNVEAPFVAFVPQWDFLDFISGEATQYAHFHLMMETEVLDLIEEDGRIVGVTASGPQGGIEIRSALVVGADGRHSTVREKSGLQHTAAGVPIDVLWFPIPRKQTDPEFSLGYVKAGQFMVMLERDTYWQCGYLIKKGRFEEMQEGDITDLQQAIQGLVPIDAERFRTVTSWDDISHLSVSVEHMPTWHRPGLICIGDAAHAMSPIGGVGINLAVQDAVAAARILAPAFQNATLTERTLRAVQKRRAFPARFIQRIQVFLQDRVISSILEAETLERPPLPFRLLKRFPLLRRIPARLIGIGIRPEHWDIDVEQETAHTK